MIIGNLKSSIMSKIMNDYWGDIAESGRDSLKRIVNQNVKMAVTGFSGAGKSVFIASLIHQLLHANQFGNLPFLKLTETNRLLAVQKQPLPDLTIPEFTYADNIQCLCDGRWPASTRSVSGLRLSILYQPDNFWLRKMMGSVKLDLDIYDYPGEWLVDLIMLKQDYPEWCRWALPLLVSSSVDTQQSQWLHEVEQLNVDANEDAIKSLACSYRALLAKRMQTGLLCMPGRFVLPGELDGAPVLDFFPLSESMLNSQGWLKSDVYQTLEARFNYYKEHVALPFYRNFFSRIDRQIILVDCLSMINATASHVQEIEQTISLLLKSFQYGQSSWIKRLFNPNIDKLLFVATKSDRVPTDQQFRLQSLLHSLVYTSVNDVRYAGVETSTMTMSAVKAAESVVAEIEGKNIHCVRGKIAEEEVPVVVYPGQIPESVSQLHSLATSSYELPDYLPPTIPTRNSQIPHIRIDKVLEFMIGDKWI